MPATAGVTTKSLRVIKPNVSFISGCQIRPDEVPNVNAAPTAKFGISSRSMPMRKSLLIGALKSGSIRFGETIDPGLSGST